MLDVRRLFTHHAPVVGLVVGLLWFADSFVGPSALTAPPAWVELYLVPAVLTTLFALAAVGLWLTKGRSGLCWSALVVLGLQIVLAALLLALLAFDARMY